MTKYPSTSTPVPRDVAITVAYAVRGLSQREISESPDLTGEPHGLTRQRVNDVIRRTCRLAADWRRRNGDDYTRDVFGITQDELIALCIENNKQTYRRAHDPRRKTRKDGE